MELTQVVTHVFIALLELDYNCIINQPKSIEEEVIINFWFNPEEVIMNL